jgi:hypothetical protein
MGRICSQSSTWYTGHEEPFGKMYVRTRQLLPIVGVVSESPHRPLRTKVLTAAKHSRCKSSVTWNVPKLHCGGAPVPVRRQCTDKNQGGGRISATHRALPVTRFRWVRHAYNTDTKNGQELRRSKKTHTTYSTCAECRRRMIFIVGIWHLRHGLAAKAGLPIR